MSIVLSYTLHKLFRDEIKKQSQVKKSVKNVIKHISNETLKGKWQVVEVFTFPKNSFLLDKNFIHLLEALVDKTLIDCEEEVVDGLFVTNSKEEIFYIIAGGIEPLPGMQSVTFIQVYPDPDDYIIK